MPFDPDQWLSDVKAKYNIPDEVVGEAASEIRKGYLRQSDYSRSMNAVGDERRRLEEVERKQRDWWEKNKHLSNAVTKFQEKFGSIEDFVEREDGRMVNNEGQSLSTEAYERAVAETQQLRSELTEFKQQLPQVVAQQQAQTANMLKFATRTAVRHSKTFKEDFDIDAFDGWVAEKVSSGAQFRDLDDAYNAWTEPKRKEREVKEREDWKTETRRELERDIASKSSIADPNLGQPRSPLFLQRETMKPKKDGYNSEAEKQASFTEAYYKGLEESD